MARQWISVLETSYLVYLLPPHYRNFNRRLIKMPKIYFYDVSIACSLLGIEGKKQLENHYLRGGLFENLVITELLKFRLTVTYLLTYIFGVTKAVMKLIVYMKWGTNYFP
jgi:predicted AAA+ superfamily ATPase